VRHGLFFAHLALEKTLKGLVCGKEAQRTMKDAEEVFQWLIYRLKEAPGLT
jgi:hypothetical protein